MREGDKAVLTVFQSTLPAGEATTERERVADDRKNFNPRFPRGKRPSKASDRERKNNFNPRFPRGKRPDAE